MAMNIHFREATNEDIPLLTTLMQSFYQQVHYPFNAQSIRDNLEEFFDNHEMGKIWLILLENETIGYATLTYGFSFEYNGLNGTLDEMYIDDPYRGKGIGSETIDFIVEESKQLSLKALHLEVEKHNEPAINLYNKSGFVKRKRVMMTKLLKKNNG